MVYRPDAQQSGEALCVRGDLSKGATLLEESLALYRELGDKGDIVDTLRTLSDVAREQGDLERAAKLSRDSLALAHEVGANFIVVGVLESMAEIARAQKRPALDVQLLALATMLRETYRIPRTGRDDARYISRIEDLRATLGGEAFSAAWAHGRMLSLEEVIEQVSARETSAEAAFAQTI